MVPNGVSAYLSRTVRETVVPCTPTDAATSSSVSGFSAPKPRSKKSCWRSNTACAMSFTVWRRFSIASRNARAAAMRSRTYALVSAVWLLSFSRSSNDFEKRISGSDRSSVSAIQRPSSFRAWISGLTNSTRSRSLGNWRPGRPSSERSATMAAAKRSLEKPCALQIASVRPASMSARWPETILRTSSRTAGSAIDSSWERRHSSTVREPQPGGSRSRIFASTAMTSSSLLPNAIATSASEPL